ncbi:MAG: DUF222 domain-containing protein [Acidimicrobiia bacterium]|jgi:hypothetical protein
MSQLRSVLDELAATSAADLSLSELDTEITELLDSYQRVEVLLADRVDELRGRDGHVSLAHPSPTSYLMDRGGLSASRARTIVSMANARERAPVTHAAWSDGRLSTDQARRVLTIAESVPDQFPDAEDKLVEVVEPLSVRATCTALEYWRQSVDGPGDLGTDVQLARRGVSLSGTVNGMRRIDGWLTQLAGETLERALDALMPPPSPHDPRTPRQRRHDALEDLARDWLEHADTPTVGGEKPQITLVTDLPALRGIAGGTHETTNGDVVDVEMLRMIACDSSVSRVVLGPEGEILDTGRKTRVWSAAQRRAIFARDRHCTSDGCERIARHCDIHHETHWADGGTTDVAKGRLLCRFHHTLEHLRLALKRRRRRRR